MAQLQRQRSCAHCKFINEATHMSSDVGSNSNSSSDADSDALLSVVWVTDVSCGRAESFRRAFVELFVGVIFSCSSFSLSQKFTGFARNFATNQRISLPCNKCCHALHLDRAACCVQRKCNVCIGTEIRQCVWAGRRHDTPTRTKSPHTHTRAVGTSWT